MDTIQPTTYTYKTVGDLAIKADVYVPKVALYDKHPVIIAIHGGGYIIGYTSYAFSMKELDEMLSRGWAVVSIDYRLNPAAFLPEIYQDVQDAYTWVRTELASMIPINPDAVAFWGLSAGGTLSLISGYKLTPRPQAIVAFYPFFADFTDPYVYNPDTPINPSLIEDAHYFKKEMSAYVPSGEGDLRMKFLLTALAEGKLGWLITTLNPDEPAENVLEVLKEYSTVFHVDNEFPPTYLIHGLEDRMTPAKQSSDMAEVFEKHGITYKLDLVPEVAHNFNKNASPEIWRKHLVPIFEFLQQHLTRAPEDKEQTSV